MPKRFAARVGDRHFCPLTAPSPHGSKGVIVLGSTVLVSGGLAARITDPLMCEAGSQDGIIATGRFDTLIQGLPAARQWDLTTHGGMIIEAGSVVIGGGWPDPSPASLAIQRIRISKFGQTEEGKRVIARLEQLEAAGNIQFISRHDYYEANGDDLGEGAYDSNKGVIYLPEASENDTASNARVLVHEGTHAADHDRQGYAYDDVPPVDKEIPAWNNETEFYKEQRESREEHNILTENYAKKKTDEEKRKYLERMYP